MEKSKLSKNKNSLSILDIIREHSKISRVSLAKLTEQTPASITKITKKTNFRGLYCRRRVFR